MYCPKSNQGISKNKNYVNGEDKKKNILKNVLIVLTDNLSRR